MKIFRTCDRRRIWSGVNHPKSGAPVMGFMVVAKLPKRCLEGGQPQMSTVRRLLPQIQVRIRIGVLDHRFVVGD